MEILTEIDINAPADIVWKVLVNFPDYDAWNPIIQKINGMPYRGNKIGFSIAAAPGILLPIVACEILIADSGERHLRWKGPAIPIAGDILSGEHYFMVQEKGENKSRFIHGENFTGLAAPALKPFLEKRITDLYNEMNRALKKRCEG